MSGNLPTWQGHIADFNDPHRTLTRVQELLPTVTVGFATPGSTDGAKASDWYLDTLSGALWVCLPAQGGGLEWRRAADQSPAAIDLSAYATKADLAGYVSSVSLSSYVRKTDIDGYNFVTQSALAMSLASYMTHDAVDSLLTSREFLTLDVADRRYMLAGTSAEETYITQEGLEIILAGYVTQAVAAATYLTEDAADSPTGFVRKGAALPYVTEAQLSSTLSGYALSSALADFVTLATADARYVRSGTGTEAVVSIGALNAYLTSYLRKADAATELGLSSYLTVANADSPTGFVRKQNFASMASTAGLVSNSALTVLLSSYVSQADVDRVITEKTEVLSQTFATAQDLADLAASFAVQAGSATALKVLELDSGSYRPEPRTNNIVTLKGDVTSIPLLMPIRSEGVSRDFILTVAFGQDTEMWSGASFTIVPATRQSETVQCRFYSATGSFTVEADGLDLANQMLVFGFTELADGKFLVTRKTVTLMEA